MFDKLVDLLVQFIRIFQFCLTIDPYQMAVRVRLGKQVKVLTPGLHFFIPFWVDRVMVENVVTETKRVGPQSLITKDGKSVTVTSVITFNIEDVKVFLLEVEGRNNIVEDSAYGSTSDFVMKKTWLELMAMESIGNELTKTVRRQAKKYGVNIINVQLADFAQCKSFRLISAQPHLL